VLNRAGDSKRNVQFGRDDLAGLSDLVIVRRHPCIDAARVAPMAPPNASPITDQDARMFLVLQRSAADTPAGFGQVRPVGLALFAGDKLYALGSEPTSKSKRAIGQGAAFAVGGSKAVARTVSTRRSPSTLTTANMLPALMGRL